MDTTSTVLDQLNAYVGDNIWEDVIYGLDYDEAATDLAYADTGRNRAYGDMVVIGGVTYRYHQDRAAWAIA